MQSWVYLFSKFTPEALLFEALLILILVTGYAAFWVLRKRRYGSVKNALPSGPVQAYLNELILSAEQLRAQLFGLLGNQNPDLLKHPGFGIGTGMGAGAGPSLQSLLTPPAAGAVSAGITDPEVQKKVQALEARMVEQTRALETLVSDKSRLETELVTAKSAAANVSSSMPSFGGGDSSAADAALQKRVAELEARLAEYNVIEDDLANLKRLQQENTLLKSQLNQAGITPASVTPGASPAAPAPAAAATPAEADAAPTAEPPVEAPSTPEIAAVDAPSDPPSGATAADPAAPPTPAESAPAAAAAADSPAVSPEEANKTDADLVAEFEKMLKG